MPRYKPYDYRQSLMVPLNLEEQLSPGTLEHALHHLIEERVSEEWFEELYANEETGRPAYSPKLLLKVLLLGYARGLIGSRRLERACRENIVFMALCCGERPDHSTLAGLVGKLTGRIERIFAEILLVCHEEGLLSGTHLSLDGLKLPGNAAREWSGSFKELRFKADKLRRKLKEELAEHRRQDRLERRREEGARSGPERAQESAQRRASLEKLRRGAERIERFLAEEEPKEGTQGKEVQSNITDNDSAKMTTSHGVIQGYNAQALVDEKHQVILHGMATGVGQDHRQIGPVLQGAQDTLELAGLKEKLPLEKAQLSADCNYHSEANLEACATYQVDPYIPDNHFRQRDARFVSQERHKSRLKQEHFTLQDFTYEEANDQYHCPQGKVLRLHARVHRTNRGETYRRYRARKEDCAQCPLRAQCLKRGAERKSLALAVAEQPATLTARMRRKIDQAQARRTYSRRLGIVEPVFANLRYNKGLNRFTYRGREKVNTQWLLYCLVHNLEKIAHCGPSYRPKGARTLFRKAYRYLRCFLQRVPSFLKQFLHSLRASSSLFLKQSYSLTQLPILPPNLLIRQSR
jgi:transposase